MKGLFQINSFYEVGSGLEQKKEFVYIEVQPGQGVYIWNDYNANGVKELNEFEIAQFAYEANYIRTFVQSADYVKTYSNQFSQNLTISPERLLKRDKKWKRALSRFSDQASYKVDRKTNRENAEDRFNPFLVDISDSALYSMNASFRNVFFFNKTDPKFGMDYTVQQVRSKNLLSNGFESRSDAYQQLGFRWNFAGTFTFSSEQRLGAKEASSDFLSGRNFHINYFSVKPKISWQRSNTTRLVLNLEQTQKNNLAEFGGQSVVISKIGAELTASTINKNAVQAALNFYSIRFDGVGNNSIAFEMLEGLNAGLNFTWSVSVQSTVAKNLQLNLIYNGRKPEDVKTIHTGGVQLRAFF
jgi:hypothetical protein